MKKLLALTLAVMMLFTLVACATEEPAESSAPAASSTPATESSTAPESSEEAPESSEEAPESSEEEPTPESSEEESSEEPVPEEPVENPYEELEIGKPRLAAPTAGAGIHNINIEFEYDGGVVEAYSEDVQISIGDGNLCSPLSLWLSCTSSRMMSLHRSTHSSQMNTEGPAISLRTSCWLLPQKEQYSSLPLSSPLPVISVI